MVSCHPTAGGLPHLLRPVMTRVVVQASAHAVIEAVTRAEAAGRETGGILLGHQYPGGHLRVTVAGDPGPHADRTRTAFRRDPAHARDLARDGYAHDRSVWIGDWHTHPDGPAHPSAVDVRAYRQAMDEPDGSFDSFLGLVVIPAAPRPLLLAWLITQEAVHPAGLWVAHPAASAPRDHHG